MTHRSASTCWRPGNVVCPQRSPGTCSPAPRPAPLAAGRESGSFSCSTPPLFVLSHNVPMANTTSNWLRFGAFLSPPVPPLRIHWPLSYRFTLHASRYCLPPTAELRKIEWAQSGRADPLSYYAPNQAVPAENPIRSHSLAAVHLLNILSWPEALDATGSKRACRTDIRRNARSPLALPDFPEFAQAVRCGVPGTP